PIPSATPATTKSQASSSAAVTSKTETSAPKKFVVGDSFSVAGIKYVVTSADSDNYEVEATGCSSETVSVMIPDTVTYEGISANVTAVGANAFAGNKVIKKVIIGKNVKSIGAKAFYGCNKLKNVIIKTSLLSKKTIGKNAFKGINAKAKVKVPKKCFKKYKSILKKRGVKGANRKVVK
nr:leucine-rich repeat domain-containing protein [Lachnospiraceae bacterium]